MAIIRVNKTDNYTVMSNTHFKEKAMSLKAKGLLSLMLSLPDTWDYSITGLVTLSKDGKDSVMSALTELEKFGYLKRTRLFDKQGRFAGYDYDIFENPNTDNANTENPCAENPNTDNPQQLNTKEFNNNVLNTKQLNNNKYQSINETEESNNTYDTVDGLISNDLIILIKKQIDYDTLLTNKGICAEDLPSVVDAIATLKTVTKPQKFGESTYSPEYVRARADEINMYHIEYVFECFYENRDKIRNIKSYLKAAVFNSTITHGAYYSNAVRVNGLI